MWSMGKPIGNSVKVVVSKFGGKTELYCQGHSNSKNKLWASRTAPNNEKFKTGLIMKQR